MTVRAILNIACAIAFLVQIMNVIAIAAIVIGLQAITILIVIAGFALMSSARSNPVTR